MQIRPETDADSAAVFALNEAAFEADGEAKLVDILRGSADPVISLVAEDDNGNHRAHHVHATHVR